MQNGEKVDLWAAVDEALEHLALFYGRYMDDILVLVLTR